MATTRLWLVLLAYGLCAASFGAPRKIFVPLHQGKKTFPGNGVIVVRCTVLNPQPVTQQEVKIVAIKSPDTEGFGHGTFSGTEEMTPPGTGIALAQNQSFSFQVNGMTDNWLPKGLIVTINQDDGYIVGVCEHQYGDNSRMYASSVPMNAGKPF